MATEALKAFAPV